MDGHSSVPLATIPRLRANGWFHAITSPRRVSYLRRRTTIAPLLRPVGLLDGDVPNVTRFIFCDPRSRAVYPDWAAIADDAVGDLRAGCADAEPLVDAFVAELTAGGGAEFTTRWAGHPVTPKRSGVKLFRHPDAGDLRLAFETLQLPDGDEQRLIVDQPADPATAAALDQLVGRVPGALRVVADAV